MPFVLADGKEVILTPDFFWPDMGQGKGYYYKRPVIACYLYAY